VYSSKKEDVPVVTLNLHKKEEQQQTPSAKQQEPNRFSMISQLIHKMDDDQREALLVMIYEKSKQLEEEYHINVFNELTKTVN
jgi:hypothetical protein